MTAAGRTEATRVAAALLGAVIDADAEGAQVLLSHTSHQVLAQAATDLARLLADCLRDPAEFRAELAEGLRQHAL